MKGLATTWLDGALIRILNQYGIDVNTTYVDTLKIEIVETLGNLSAGQPLIGGQASVLYGLGASLKIAEDVFALWGSAGFELHGEQVTAHELVHVITFMDQNLADAQKSPEGRWLQEGIADYLAGGANATVADVTNRGADLTGVMTAIDEVFGNLASYTTTEQYAASYLAVR